MDLGNTEGFAEGGGGGGTIALIIWLAIIVFMIATMWKVFSKAGKPGWFCIIPILNVIVIFQIAGRPGWWFILTLIPIVGLIIWIIAMLDLAKKFGKGAGFGIGLWLLGIIFFPILAFGSAKYEG